MSGPRLTKVERAQIEAARAVLSPWGLASAVEMGGKHVILRVWARCGAEHRLAIMCTPRNPDDAVDFARQKAVRLMRLINERAGY